MSSNPNTVIVAVGSTRKPKLGAVQDALASIGKLLAPEKQIEIVGVEVESGVSHTPVSREELMQGARQRAEAIANLAAQNHEPWNYFVGLEGGLDVVQENGQRRVFLESWAYVSNGARGFFGRSGSIEVAEAIAEEVVDRGVELSIAIDHFAGEIGIRDAQGAWGVLSDNLISRQDSFRIAVIAAFAPFYNAKMYRRTSVKITSVAR
ncbi:MAG TPA: inosine/xanthosine triphosphatase [Candidatus Dormibacteraeota bacterium]|jgi:inosine/xanthosine triphosphatase|nr:inosine/xanthosine triphosphatase [Candidatus Dormibacteraeota bacterium]